MLLKTFATILKLFSNEENLNIEQKVGLSLFKVVALNFENKKD